MSGSRTALVIGVAAGVVGVALVIFAVATGGDESAKYGQVPIPGRGTVELPEGDVYVFYEERTKTSEDESLPIPGGLEYSVRPAGGGPPLTLEDVGFQSEEVSAGDGTRATVNRIDVPAAGPYVVQGNIEGEAGPDPALTLGRTLLQRILGEGLPFVIGIGGLLALAGAIWLLSWMVRRRRAGERPLGPGA
jgi:hypothetical protein